MAADGPLQDIVVILGDDRGLTTEDEGLVEAEARSVGAPVRRVSLGPDVLFTNQCVILVQHYLDKAALARLMESAPGEAAKAHVQLLQQPGAGAWLSACPFHSLNPSCPRGPSSLWPLFARARVLACCAGGE